MGNKLKRNTLKAWDAINGAEGMVYAVINGNMEEMIYVKNIEANADKNKSELKVLGQTGVKHKSNGWKGTGKMTMYYTTTLFRKMMIKYIKNDKDTYFDLIIENEDPSSELGQQKVMLKQVNLDGVVLASLNVDSTELEEDISFTFNDAEIIESFNQLISE